MHRGKLQSMIPHLKNRFCQSDPLLHTKSNNYGKNHNNNFDSIIIQIGHLHAGRHQLK